MPATSSTRLKSLSLRLSSQSRTSGSSSNRYSCRCRFLSLTPVTVLTAADTAWGLHAERRPPSRGECNDRTRMADFDGDYAAGAGLATQKVTGSPAAAARPAERNADSARLISVSVEGVVLRRSAG